MSSKQALIDASIRHKVFLLRKATGTFKQILPFIQKVEAELHLMLLNAPTVISRTRYENMITEVKKIYNTHYDEMNKTITSQAKALVKYEADFTKQLVDKTITVNTEAPTINQLNAAAFTSILDRVVLDGGGFDPSASEKGGKTVQDLMDAFKVSKIAETTGIIRTGYATGETSDALVTKLQESNTGLVRRQAKTLVDTIINHVASQAHAAFYQENEDIITGYQVIATLDNATCMTCGSLDGVVFDKDEFQEPPYHFSCRCTFVAVFGPDTNNSDVTGTRPAQQDDGDYEEVSTKTTYNSWLKGQSDDFQDEVLGPAKADLFRKGSSVRSFVDDNHQPLTLDQLTDKDKEFN